MSLALSSSECSMTALAIATLVASPESAATVVAITTMVAK